jgi:glutaminyl-tRNA synthetase
MKVVDGYAEPALLEDNSGVAVQFERLGYFFKDTDSTPEHPVYNRTVTLRDNFKAANNDPRSKANNDPRKK